MQRTSDSLFEILRRDKYIADLEELILDMLTRTGSRDEWEDRHEKLYGEFYK